MDEAILLPSPNWFLVSGLAVTIDGWIIYGGPAKSLCVLEPLSPDNSVIVSEKGYRTHFYPKVHGEKITSLDISPTWSEKKSFISGSADGTVKLWNLEQVDKELHLKFALSHSMHSNEREDVAGVGYSTNKFAITVGSYGRIVKWDLQSNVVKTYNLILSKFKPTCLACSPHASLKVAVGTKQGVVLVLDLKDKGTTIFKVRSHDDEVLSLSWCPQFSVITKKFYKEWEPKYSANKRMEKIRQEAAKESEDFYNSGLSKTLPDDSFGETVVEEEDLFDVYKDPEEEEFGHKKYTPEVIAVKEEEKKSTEFDYLAECQNLKDKILKNKDEPEPSINSLVDALDKTHVDDSEDNSSKSEDISCKTEAKEIVDTSSTTECTKHQKHLLASIGKYGQLRVWSRHGKLFGSTLIQNRTFVPNKYQGKLNYPSWGALLWYKPDVLLITDGRGQLLQCNPLALDCRGKLQTHIVDSIHKRGTYCIVSNAPRVQHGYGAKVCKKEENDTQTNGNDSKKEQIEVKEENQEDIQEDDQEEIKEDNQINTKDVLPEDKWLIWTAAQDRSLVCYSMTQRKKIYTYNSCGGYVYGIQTCPYDAKKVAICVGDGAVRVWEANIIEDNEEKIGYGQITSFWQNVQGKVLVVAWHPTKENLLAFATAESRVGVLDTSGGEKPARVLELGITGSVYSLCWGERNELYVTGGGDVLLCHLKREGDYKTISVELEGSRWKLTAVSWHGAGLLVGSADGAVALLDHTEHRILTVNFVFKKLINSLEWHPLYTSSSSEESSLKNLIAVCSMDKCAKIIILQHNENEEGKHELSTHKHLVGHKGCVLQLAWSPHHEGRLASTCTDMTARVWDVPSGSCIAIYPGGNYHPISIAWSAFPGLSSYLMSGGADHSVRLWRLEDYPPEAYKESLPLSLLPKKEKKKILAKKLIEEVEVEDKSAEEAVESDPVYGEGKEADQMAFKLKTFKKFLLPITSKQMAKSTVAAARKLADKVMGVEREKSEKDSSENEYDTDFIKMFGSTNELNELLDLEMEHHLESKDTDAWIMLAIFRGQMDAMIQFAAERDLLCPFLVSLSPCVSFKYWKDVTQLYLAQMNRAMAQNKETKPQHERRYGGAVFKRAALWLALHDARSALGCLLEAGLYREAYVLCRVRHMESLARDTLQLWLKETTKSGYMKIAVLCHIALGDLYGASTAIVAGSAEDETLLSLAADLAKGAGQHTFAGHIEDKKEQMKQTSKEVEEALEQLPSRIELILKNCGIKGENGDANRPSASQEGITDESGDIETQEAQQVE